MAVTFLTNEDEKKYVKTINDTAPDENGNIVVKGEGIAYDNTVSGIDATTVQGAIDKLSGGNVDLEGYATEQWVKDQNYLTDVPDGYAKTTDIPTKPEDIGAQPSGNYALKSEIPSVPVQSVNGKTGAVKLSASDVGARPDNWMPSAQEVGALPNTYTPPNQTAEQVGADPKGTATAAVSQHNTADDSHNDIRLELKAINEKLTAFFDSDNRTLDELSEIVAYITSNKSLIDSITTSKVSVADIINNLTSNVTNKPLSAAQGVVLKGLIDTLSGNLANYQPKGDYALRSEIPTVPTKISQFQNDAGYIKDYTETDPTVPAWAKQPAKPTYTAAEVGALPSDTTIPTVPTKVSAFTNDAGYLKESDKPDIVAMVIESLGGNPVFGIVDENNNIIVSGDLPDGTYSVKYEMEDGSTVDIGQLVLSDTPDYTNFADPTSADWKTGVRLTNDINTTKELTGGVTTNYVSVQTGDIVEVTGINFSGEDARTGYDFGGDYAACPKTSVLVTSASFSNVTYDANSLTCTINAPQSNNMRIRFSGLPTGTSEDVIIKIKRNGEYL